MPHFSLKQKDIIRQRFLKWWTIEIFHRLMNCPSTHFKLIYLAYWSYFEDLTKKTYINMLKNKQTNTTSKYIVMVFMIIVATTAEIAVIKIIVEEVSLQNFAKTYRNSCSWVFYRIIFWTFLKNQVESYFSKALYCKSATLLIRTLPQMFLYNIYKSSTQLFYGTRLNACLWW